MVKKQLKNKKILFVITEYWYFISHRINLAYFLHSKGYEIHLLTNLQSNIKHDERINIINWKLNRGSKNIFNEINSINELSRTIQFIKPNIVYSVGLKPILYSSFLSKFKKKLLFVFAFAGLGSLFINLNIKKKIVQYFFFSLLTSFLNKSNSLIIFQNHDDKNLFNSNIKINYFIKIIKGSGVDTNLYFKKNNLETLDDCVNVVLPSRFIYDKGIMDFIYIAKELKKKLTKKVNFLLVGMEDNHNPSNIKLDTLKKFEKKGIIEIIMNVNDITDIYNISDIICFPSFREGLPKVLLEASSCGIPSVAYNVPGCKEIIDDNINGFLIPFRDKEKMIDKLKILITDSKLRNKFGIQARNKIINNFSEEIVFNKIQKELNFLLIRNI